MAVPAEKLRMNAAPSIHEQSEQRKQQLRPLKPNNEGYTQSEENRISKVIWSVLLSALVIVCSIAVYMHFRGASESWDSKITAANEMVFDAEENFNEMSAELQKMVTPDRIAAYAEEKGWVKIPDNSKNYVLGDSKNKLEVASQE